MNEVKGKNFICTEDGKINKDSIGWSKRVFANCDIEKAYFRRKVWNHYMCINKDYICAFAIVKLDYAGCIFIDFYDLKNNTEIHKSITIPLCSGMIIHNAIGSYAHYQNKDLYLNILRKKNRLYFMVKWDEIDIDASFSLQKESLNLLIPWSDKRFHYTSKQFPLKVQGYIRIENNDDEKILLNNASGFIDYGRGVWEREKTWYWLTCSFKNEEDHIGLNLGGNWTDNTGTNENAIKINRNLYKIQSDIIFERIDEDTWSIKSRNNELEYIDLIYKIDKAYNKINKKFIVKSSLKQHIGKLSGIIKLEDKKLNLDKVLCWFEDHYAKW